MAIHLMKLQTLLLPDPANVMCAMELLGLEVSHSSLRSRPLVHSVSKLFGRVICRVNHEALDAEGLATIVSTRLRG